MKVHIVNYELGRFNGILSKYANKMKEELEKLGVKVTVSDKPQKADINHHINYRSYIPSGGIDTLMVTHIWEGDKLDRLKEGLKTATGICFSKETETQLREKGLETTTILPAHDSLPRKPITVSITTNVYPDGCKREAMFYELLKKIDCSKFHFIIMGSGWDVNQNANISYLDHFEPEDYLKILHMSEYNLYFGLDEGSMGVLDAKNVGLKIIAPLQGFHREIGIDYPFKTIEELVSIFNKLAENPVQDWTWENYCKKHLTLWKKLKQT
jgi:hypothetical protein